MSKNELGHDEVDRRPLKTREARFAGALTRWLVAWRVSANMISVFGMLAGLLAGWMFAVPTHWPDYSRAAFIAGAVFVQLRLLANMLDGMVAISSGTDSPTGELYNEVPDRVSDTAILVGFGYAAGGHAVFGWAAAVGAMFTAYVRAMGKAGTGKQVFCGPFAKPQRMFLVTVTGLWCGLAPMAWQPVFDEFPWGVPACLLLLVALGTVWTSLRRLSRIARQLKRGDSA